MRGVCISFSPRNVGTIWPESADANPLDCGVPVDETPFCFFFRPVFPHMRDLYWFASGFQGTPFCRLIAEDDGIQRLEEAQVYTGLDSSNFVLHRPGTLPELAPYLTNDWIDLIGLRGTEPEAVATACELAKASDGFGRCVDEVAELAFFCAQGILWEFYSRDPSLLDLVVASLRPVAGLGIQSCELRRRDALFGGSASG